MIFVLAKKNTSQVNSIVTVGYLPLTYIPDKPTESTRPITVEIQQTFDWAFFRRLNRYKVMPFVMVFAVKGFSSKSLINEFILNGDGYYTISTKLWAKSLRIYTLDSIAENVTIEKLNPIIALAYFLCAQEKSIIGLELRDNTHIQKLYLLADKVFEEAQMEKKRKILEEEEGESVTPIEEDENGDLVFVKKIMTHLNEKRMDWKAC